MVLNEDDLKENLNLCDRTSESQSVQNDTSSSKKEDCQINGNRGIENTIKVDTTRISITNQTSKDKNVENQAAIQQKPVLRNTDVNKTKPKKQRNSDITDKSSRNQSYALSKSQSEGNPFHHKQRGRIIKIDRPNIRGKIQSMMCHIVCLFLLYIE
ncbi:hypothetical protein NQ314_005047 [Rhamnusium bicolor]|uniref:Uncharacterized protein n=1 Tax=Rhamnusium bicolor TaxID=1586634 RepID=A0AAV8ZKD9_9CUCU|nr:hypothetical protein NQ314_005047 [Rhamnusium bicolor]